MKYILICMLILITGCSDQQTKNHLKGVFTASSETEFGITDDTLLVSKPNAGEYIYQIERHSGVIKKLDGEVFPKEIKIVTWTLEFDPAKQTLFELKGGKTLIWNDENKTLKLGDKLFRQIADNSR